MDNEKKEFTAPLLTTTIFDNKTDINTTSVVPWSIGDVSGVPDISDF